MLQLLQADLTVEANYNRYQLPLTQFSLQVPNQVSMIATVGKQYRHLELLFMTPWFTGELLRKATYGWNR